ncbi:MAG: MFS transporter, partial [Rhizobiaceae bacterium]|nr:MFS transporter [Rhizobiaceae bacterium]
MGTTPTGGDNRLIVASLALSMLLASLGTSIANIALPAMADAFAAPFHQLQGVVVSYLAGLTLTVVVAGRLGDIYGLRRTFLAGLCLFALASALCGVATSLWFLIAARAIQGAGAAFLMTLSMALLRETASEARTGRAMGLIGTVSALGTALGPSLGGLLLPAFGWRGVFLVQVPLAVLALFLAWASLPRISVSKLSRLVPLRQASARLLPNLLVNVLVAAVMMSTLVVGPFYLTYGLGLATSAVGLAMSVGPVISILTGVPSGRIVDRWGARPVVATGLAMLACGSLLLSLLPAAIGLAGYILAIVVLTPGYQMFQAGNNTAALADVPPDRRGLASGLLNLSRNLGLIVGASAMGAIFATGVGSEDFANASVSSLSQGLRLTFVVGGA